ncbi:MAG: SDR family oxidoreductase [Pseudomonadota bacterium]
MADRFAGKTALVTGGSRGIGRAIVGAFLDAGARVVTCGRGDRPDCLPQSVSWVTADVSNPADSDRLIAQSAGIDILVNNAGIQIEKQITQTTDDDWDLLMGANCRGVFNCCRSAMPVLARRNGSIVNIGSISANTADPGLALYNASKAFVHGLTRSIAVDHGPNVRCNAVSPGWIMTDMAEAAFAAAADPARAKADALARHAAGRMGRPEDVAAAVLWLASDDARFVTGQCLVVDGGLVSASPLRPDLF